VSKKDEGNVLKYVLFPCRIGKDGKFVYTPNAMPSGYHHILKVFKDGSYYPIATVTGNLGEDKALEVAKVLVGKKFPIEVDEKFYNNKFCR
jgi:hypothetical protein